MDDVKPDMDQLVCEVKSEPMSMKLEPEDCGVSEIKYSCNLDCSDLKEEIECDPDTVDSSIPECQVINFVNIFFFKGNIQRLSTII
ncbi:hypothetical protein C0J52_23104 [Blattella germanica]|nr:hypothetical protein C0J52_23104 [Blattella germanica]